MDKKSVINILNATINEENKDKIQGYIEMILSMSESDWNKFVQEHNIIDLEEDVQKILQEKMNEDNAQFIRLNDLVSYGVTGDTIHIHLVPKDARSMLTRNGIREANLQLIDALESIRTMLEKPEFSNIKNVYAVSGIMRGVVAEMFSKLGFDTKTLTIEEAKEDEELGHFYERFKEQKMLGRAIILAEQVSSDEWEENKNAVKKELGRNKNDDEGR